MCAIIGFESDNATEQDLRVLKRAMIASRIRGKHASGIAWFNGEKICCEKQPLPIDRFLQDFDLHKIVYVGKVKMIAHARYSTSDLKYNQPIVSDSEEIAIAHNGVVTQEAPENWENIFGYKCKTKNDSELLLQAIQNKDNMFEKFPSASIAMVVLNKNGVKGIRNGKRPLWCGKLGAGTLICSTFDILVKAGVEVASIRKYEAIDSDLQIRYLNESKF